MCRQPGAPGATAATVDLTVHAWDLARGIGADDPLDPAALVRRVYRGADKDTESLASSGLFAAPVPVAGHVDLHRRMLALFGRRA